MDPQLWEEIARGDADAEIEALIRLRHGFEPPSQVRIVARFGDVATCRLRRRDILTVRRHPAVASLKAARRLAHDLPAPEPLRLPPRSRPTRHRRWSRRPRVAQTGRGVVVGVVDYGCDVAHMAFRNRDGTTRLDALWDQGGEPGPGGPPAPYGKGRVYDRQEIDRALRSDDPYGEMAYHPAPSSRPEAGSHGTHVLDIAAGSGRGRGPTGMAPEAALVFVHVASEDTDGLRNFGDSVGILEAVDFIIRQAGDRPCVINISMGRHGGPHDGSTLVELAIDQLLAARQGLAIVQSAGNYFERDIHASGRLGSGASERLGWFVPDTDTTTNELEIWYPRGDRLSVEIVAPNAAAGVILRPGDRNEIVIDGEVVGRAYSRIADPNNGDNQIDIFLYGDAPRGEWKVAISADHVRDGRWHAWIERDGDAATQSYFIDAPIDPAVTCGTIAHGRLAIQVAAHHGRSRRIARFSSAGPSRDGRRLPVIAAPGIRVPAARSAVPGRENSHREITRKSGTSMAAPHVAGLLALMLEAAPRARARDLRKILRNTARPIASPGDRRVVRSAWGALDAAAAVRRAALETGLHDREDTETVPPTTSEWRLIENWVSVGAVPVAGGGMLPTNRSVRFSTLLPEEPIEASRYLARALMNRRAIRVPGGRPLPFSSQSLRGGSLLDALAVSLVSAVAPSRAEWHEVAAFIETQTAANRGGATTARLFDGIDAANRITIAYHLACRRLQRFPGRRGRAHHYCSYPATSPVDPPIRILARALRRAGPLVDWTLVPIERRRAHVMERLVRRYGYPRAGAAGIVGNLEAESGLIPERVEGSATRTPRTSRPRGGGAARRHAAADIRFRSSSPPRGPRLPGVGLAQWTTAQRRRNLFAHRFEPLPAGEGVLFFMDAQIDFLVHELRSSFPALDRRLRRAAVSLNDAADDFVYDFERPGAILEPDPDSPGRMRRRPRTDPQVRRVFRARRRRARLALQAHQAARRVDSLRTAVGPGDGIPVLTDGHMLVQEGAANGGSPAHGVRVLPETLRRMPAGLLIDVAAPEGQQRRLISDRAGRLRPGFRLVHQGAPS